LRFYRLLVFSIFVICAWPASALEYRTETLGDGTSFVLVSGPFLPDESLVPFTSAVIAAGAKLVTFDSPGGNIDTAIRLGRLIRAAKLNTVQIRKMECASACSLAFVGGVLRSADPGSIGVHRSSFTPDATISRDDAVAGIQAVTAEIITYLGEMGVDPKLLAFSLKYDQTDIRYLSASEMAELHVTTSASEPAESFPASTTASREQPSNQLETAAVGFVRHLIEADGTNPSAALNMVINSYADTVDYYGKIKTLPEVVADKRKYFLRWPERAYTIRSDSLIATCANSRCMVSGVYDWIVRSLARNRQSQGAARFTYTIAIGSNPKVVAEDGKVISKR
jgi:hypothetical protein